MYERERISRQAADRALGDIQNSVSRAAVCRRFAEMYNREKRNCQRYDKTDVPESELRAAALWNLYCAGAFDGLSRVTIRECVPEFPDEYEPMEGEE